MRREEWPSIPAGSRVRVTMYCYLLQRPVAALVPVFAAVNRQDTALKMAVQYDDIVSIERELPQGVVPNVETPDWTEHHRYDRCPHACQFGEDTLQCTRPDEHGGSHAVGDGSVIVAMWSA